MSYLENQFYPAVLEQFSEQLSAVGFRVLLFTAPNGNADHVLEDILRYRAEAAILASTHLSSALVEECRLVGVPVILFNRTTRKSTVSSVTGDNTKGAWTIAAFLDAAGHQKPAYIAGLEDSSTSRDRERGFFSYFAERQLPAPARVVGHFCFEAAKEATRNLLSGEDRPDAIFCANDHTAFAAIQVARFEYGLDIPADVSIVGFDNVETAAWPSFNLTTYSQPISEMVNAAVSTLSDLLMTPVTTKRNTVVPGRLIVRGSTRLPQTGIRSEHGTAIWELCGNLGDDV
jgi:DNA-binding LacI/PurR family transcriptional regulator